MNEQKKKALIIGCGIAGSAVALFLKRAGFEAEIYEARGLLAFPVEQRRGGAQDARARWARHGGRLCCHQRADVERQGQMPRTGTVLRLFILCSSLF